MSSAEMSAERPSSGRGILKIIDAEEMGRIEFPALTPHLDWRVLDETRVILVSERFNTMLSGRIYADLLPLLDGKRSRRELADMLANSYRESAVSIALAALATRGYIVSGNYTMEQDRAAFWSSLGASPRAAESRLTSALGRGGVVCDDGHLASKLVEVNGSADTASCDTLRVFVCTDFLNERNAEINRQHRQSGLPWMLVRPVGVEALISPVFQPADADAACWECLSYRLRVNDEVHAFVRNRFGNDAAFLPCATESAFLDAIYGLVSLEISKWLVLREFAPLHKHALTIDGSRLSVEHHKVMRRPQCFACGDPKFSRPDRSPMPVRLQASPKTIRNSGGIRSVTPERTLARYRHLVDRISGVVTWLESTGDATDPWLHTHWAGSNFALRSGELETLRKSLRSKAAGKGSTSAQSEVSALCEAVERYSGALHGDEIVCRKSFKDFQSDGDTVAIHPNEIQLFSALQLGDAKQINAEGHPYNFVPNAFNYDEPTNWTPVWSLSEERHKFLPTQILYATPPELRDPHGLRCDSNGCASGNTLEEAILQGFFELVERDAFAIWWYNRIRQPGVNIESFDDPYLAAATAYYRDVGRDLRILDITHDLNIPVFVAVSRTIDEEYEDIIYGAGAHLDASVALMRAICELNQFLNWKGAVSQRSFASDLDAQICVEWFKEARLAEHPYLEASPDIAPRQKSDFSSPSTRDTREDIEQCRGLIESHGMEMLVLDQTRPDIGMPVARVIVPGMRHFWQRFAPGRLYDVPVTLGWCQTPLDEACLNPAHVII